ncbi:MAG: D-alanyl-D-alanine carboxypeptidase family protein [Parvularculaceae bacterium]
MAALYVVGFNASALLDPEAAVSRFETLHAAGRSRPAASYGERALHLRRQAGENELALAPLKADVARAMIGARRYERATVFYEDALASAWAGDVDPLDRAAMEEHLARAHMAAGNVARAVQIYAGFLDLAGDAGAGHDPDGGDPIEALYAGAIAKAADRFAEALKPLGDPKLFAGSREHKLLAARHMAELGAFYALRNRGLYAAAGLLSSSYGLRKEILGGDHADTVQVALILGPVYKRIDRFADAENLYLEAFHAQEKAKGANSPDLSLYIKLLAGVYEDQGRATEAQALYEHMRSLFRDAFGEQRYASNRERDRTLDVDRPVAQQFVQPTDYAPQDLVPAVKYSVPLSKPADLDEMMVRRAADVDGDADPREANLPARLAQLLSLCRGETGERLSLRSGYRSYHTQHALYGRFGHRGTVTPPGMSEHQLGLAADIDVNGRLMRQSDRAFQCFEENAFRFGFILSYPPGNDYLPGDETFEPWHWRYVGISTAQLYREAGPVNKPQEFLANLSCYADLAASSGLGPIGEADVCLKGRTQVADASEQAPEPGDATARKLNNDGQGHQTR